MRGFSGRFWNDFDISENLLSFSCFWLGNAKQEQQQVQARCALRVEFTDEYLLSNAAELALCKTQPYVKYPQNYVRI